jgi:hypothetical protein
MEGAGLSNRPEDKGLSDDLPVFRTFASIHGVDARCC